MRTREQSHTRSQFPFRSNPANSGSSCFTPGDGVRTRNSNNKNGNNSIILLFRNSTRDGPPRSRTCAAGYLRAVRMVYTAGNRPSAFHAYPGETVVKWYTCAAFERGRPPSDRETRTDSAAGSPHMHTRALHIRGSLPSRPWTETIGAATKVEHCPWKLKNLV